jgi:16S rRNA (cytidine1402-2'-O)-methyltransferase
MGILYIVSTPIGNLADISYRAIEILRTVDRVLAEDTRRTSILFRRYDIPTPLVSAHAHNEEARSAQILEWLEGDGALALVSDAGTPLLSDPGARIVRHVLHAGHEVVPVPGASAILAALVASGIEAEPFTFLGFAPRSGRARDAWLDDVAGSRHTAVVFEAPGRLGRLLDDLAARAGAERRVAVARELTKVHESIFRGTLAEAVAYYGTGPVRGEIVLVLAPAPAEAAEAAGRTHDRAVELAAELIAQGRGASAVAKELAATLAIPRNEAYSIALAAAAAGRGEAD